MTTIRLGLCFDSKNVNVHTSNLSVRKIASHYVLSGFAGSQKQNPKVMDRDKKMIPAKLRVFDFQCHKLCVIKASFCVVAEIRSRL